MSDESATPSVPKSRRKTRRGPGDRLRDAIIALGAHHGHVLSHDEKAWASITFAGTRHAFTLLFAGDEAVEAGEHLIAELPEHEFTIAGQLVADAAVTSADHRMLPSPRLVVECEILMLEEG